MRFTAFLPALLGLAAAVPYNDMVDSPETAMAAARWFGKRKNDKLTPAPPACKTTPATACTSAPTGYGPTASPDTVPNFKNHRQISKMAAQADTPKDYTQVFQNQDGSANGDKYITYFNFQSYDINACATKCDQTSGCAAFNLYFERNPTVSTDPLCCPNPPSMTNIKCALWGSTLDKKSASNKGQYRNSFEVVMGGSNGYNRIGVTSTSRPASTSTTSPGSKPSPATTSSTASSTKPVSTTSPSSNSTSAQTSSETSAKVEDSSPSSPSSTAASNQGFRPAIDPQVNSASSSASPPSMDLSVAPTTTADSGIQSSSAPTTSSEAPSSTEDSSSTSLTYLSSTDEVQPITGTEPGSPITATAETSSASTGCATPVATPAITFNLNKTAVEGENIFVYGSIDQLGNWQVKNSYPLKAYYFIENGRNESNWYGTIDVAAGTYFEYKYFQRNANYSISWANPPNMRYTVPTGCEKLIVQSDQWPGTEDGTS